MKRPQAPVTPPTGAPEEPFPDDSAEPWPNHPLDSPADTRNPEDFNDPAQPEDEDGVSEDMGTLAFHPGLSGTTPMAAPNLPIDSITRPADSEPLTPEQIRTRAAAIARGDFSQLTDAEVMLELRSGNMAAFDILLAKYRKPIIHFMFRMVHNQAVAEELAQEVFLRVYRSRVTDRAGARLSTWLYRIAIKLGVNHARDTRHERSASTIYLDETDAAPGPTPDVADSPPPAEATILHRAR